MSRMVLENFKSYAGVRDIGPFHACFTAVVGANGSGKSNVIDALLFVFGFKAKQMRQGKLSGLIHNSIHYPSLDYCQVSIHFQDISDGPVLKVTKVLIAERDDDARGRFRNHSHEGCGAGREDGQEHLQGQRRDKHIHPSHISS